MQPDISDSLIEDFEAKMKVKGESTEDEPKIDDNHQEDQEIDLEEEDDDHEVELVDATDEEFSFICGVLKSPIAAEEAFDNGQIRPFFPLFNRDLLLSDIDFEHLRNRSRKDDNNNNSDNPPTSSNEEISGPYCEWSSKKANPADGSCKKSNSTGFSKLWRFRDFINRSNSDGRDAFVFVNDNNTTTSSSSKVVKKEDKVVLEKKEKISETQNKKKIKKSEAALAHEVYTKSRAKHVERLRFRPDFAGFFTNVNGGLTRNVHPF